jgi:hypothetical protein
MIFLNLQIVPGKMEGSNPGFCYLSNSNTTRQYSLSKRKWAHCHSKKISLITKEEALSFLNDSFPGQKERKSLKDNPYSDSIDIQLMMSIAVLMKKNFCPSDQKNTGVEDVEYGQTWLRVCKFSEIHAIRHPWQWELFICWPQSLSSQIP